MSIVLQIGAVSTDNSIQKMAANKDPVHIDTLPPIDDIYAFHAPPPQQTYSSCFGLPYQDHNYGAPPPPTPPQSPPPMKMNGHIDVVEETVNSVVAKAVSEINQTVPIPTTTEATNDSVIDDSITRCICDYQHDDGYMICCDKCSVWQHIDCMCIDRNNIPDAYCCEQCEPRLVDKKKARDLQTRKREEIDSSATDTDPDEAAHHIALLKAQASANKKGKTKRVMKKEIKDNKAQKLKKQKEKKKERKEKRAKLGTSNNIDVTVTVSKIKLQNNKENAKKLPQLKSPKKNRSVDFQIDEPKESWNSSGSPWVDGYEPARNNHYSSALQEILSVNKFNGLHAEEVKKVGELQVQLCCVSEVKKNRKGLKTADNILKNKAIIEYVGRVMLKDQYDTNNIFFKMLHPFVLFYSNFDNTNLCIDASNYGNEARFVRRSCHPNAEIRHIVSSGSIRFYIFSTLEIPSGTEITIPFDYQYKDCSFSVECACSKVSCAVSNKKKRKRSNSQNGGNKGEMSPIICRTSKRCQAQKAKEEAESEAVKEEVVPVTTPVVPPDTSFLESLANAAVAVSMAEQSLSEQTTQPIDMIDESPEKPPEVPEDTTNPDITIPGLLEGETEEQAAEREKKMTREERKMHAIMKAFEKLEKREERRKEALARLETTKKTKIEKSHSEDLESSPAVEVKQETQTEQKTIKGKRRKSHPARRRSRMNSGNSECTVGSEDSNLAAPVSAPNTPSPITDNTQPRVPNTDNNYRFLKTKRHLMNEWLSEKTQLAPSVVPPSSTITDNTVPVSTPGVTTPTLPSTKVEPLEVNVEETMVFTCLPSPRNTNEYMRRNSHSSCDKPGQCSSIGSAKKRWLRQAMCESGQSSDSGKESPAPYCDGTSPSHSAQLPSPGGSPAIDFVTPLKKRRLARESLSAEQPPTPSTLSPSLPVTVDEPVASAQTLFGLEDSNSNSVTASNSPKSSLIEEKGEEEPMDHETTAVKTEVTESKPCTLKDRVLSDSMVDSSMEVDSNTDNSVVKTEPSSVESTDNNEPVVCGKTTASEQVVKVESPEGVSETSELSGVASVSEAPVNSGEIKVSSQSPLKSPSVTNDAASSVLPESSRPSEEDEKQTENKEDSSVVTSNSVSLTLNVDKNSGICSSTEIASSDPLCSADTSSSAETVNCENAQNIGEEIHQTQIQPSSTAALDSVSLDNQGSNTDRTVLGCDSAEASSCLSSAIGDVSCTTPSHPPLPHRTNPNCDASLVSVSSASETLTSPENDNLHVAQSSSSSDQEKLTLLNVPGNSTDSNQPEYDPAVSSTSQSGLPLQSVTDPCPEASETFSPGVSSTVSEPLREQVSSVTVDGLKPIAGVVGETSCVPAACDSSISQSLTSEHSAPAHLNSSMTVMSADSTSAAPPLPPPPPPQPPPPPPGPAKKKVSLLEYRKRYKSKGNGSSTSPCLLLTSGIGGSVTPPQGGNTPTLAPLPFFDPSSPGKSDAKEGFSSPLSKDEEVRWPGRQRKEKLSLTERLRMEFGLEDSDEEDSSPEKRGDLGENSPSPPPPPPPSNAPPPPSVGQPLDSSMEVIVPPVNHVSAAPLGPGIGYPHGNPRGHLGSAPLPVLPPSPVTGQPRLGPAIPGAPIPHLMSAQGYSARPHPSTVTPSHPTPRSQSPHNFNQPQTGANIHTASGPLYPSAAPNHSGEVNNLSRLQGPAQHQPVYCTPQPQQRPFQRSNSYSPGPQRPRLGGQPSYNNHNQYSAHAPTRLPHFSSGAVPPPPPQPVTNSNHPYPGKPQTARGATHSQAYTTRNSSNNSHTYSHKKYY